MEVRKIYFDMDGVLADFERGVRELCNLEPLSQNAKHRDKHKDDTRIVHRDTDYFCGRNYEL
jgi:phosphoglycolate phosphatase-like HAD superfamily hydrolase